jgi:hypothetical protein
MGYSVQTTIIGGGITKPAIHHLTKMPLRCYVLAGIEINRVIDHRCRIGGELAADSGITVQSRVSFRMGNRQDPSIKRDLCYKQKKTIWARG